MCLFYINISALGVSSVTHKTDPHNALISSMTFFLVSVHREHLRDTGLLECCTLTLSACACCGWPQELSAGLLSHLLGVKELCETQQSTGAKLAR